MTLRWRIVFILAGLALGVSVLATVASYLDTSSQLRSSIDASLRGRAATINVPVAIDRPGGRGDHGGPGADNQPADGGCPLPGSLVPVSAAQLVTNDGRVTPCLAGSPSLPFTDADQSVPVGHTRLRTGSIDGVSYRVLSAPWYGGGTLQLAISLSSNNSILHRLRLRLAGLVAVATILAAALGWMVATRLARPIRRLQEATHRMATTLDLTTPIDVQATGEVGSLAASFATLVAAVRRSQEQQRRLVSDASHEMRTPLTSLRSNLELISQIERLPEGERGEVVADVLDDVDELSALLAELVDLSSDLAASEPSESVDLGHLARTVASRAKRRVGRDVSVSDDLATEMIGRPRQLERAIANLVENAIKYSPPTGPIEIVVCETTVAVRDRGPGIALADLEHIFDRFYRAVDARTQPGSGLGLSIVEEIVRSHGGHVFARNRNDGGAEVGFTLAAAGTTGT